MSTIAIIINVIFSAGVILGVVGHLAWAIITQQRDEPALVTAHQAPVRRARAAQGPRVARQPLVWPAR